MFTTIVHNSRLITIYDDYRVIPRNHNHTVPVFAINSPGCFAHAHACETCQFKSSNNCRPSIAKFFTNLRSTHPEVFI